MRIFNFQFSIFNKFSKPQFSNVFGFFLKAIGYKLKADGGMAMLATVLILMLIMVAVGLSMISSGIFEGVMSETERKSQEAHLASIGGVKDAMMRIARNKNFSTSTGYFILSDPSNCSLYGSTVCAKVIVEKDAATTCSQSISAGQDCIISLGTLESSARKTEVILNVNATSGKMTIQSWTEK